MTNPFLAWLDRQCSIIADLELRGKKAALVNDASTYRAVMQQKAELLADFYENGKPLANVLPAELQDNVCRTLRKFSGNARQALELESVFYMSALLYKDNHPADEPNNLEALRNVIREQLEKDA